MCGIAGVVNHNLERPVPLDDLKRMCNSIAHRGPDDEGFFVDANAGLGMRRLSIIDLATGHQPISNEDGRIWIVFNGEIYNYRDLRADLESRGHEFSSDTDTETIVHAYEEYGDDCVERLNGMFAFAIWDRPRRRLMIARDRLGIKPLYYYDGPEFFAFGSEIKAILELPDVPRNVDLQALDTYLTFEYVPAPKSMFEGIKKLLPGHRLVVENGRVAVSQYWDVRKAAPTDSEDELAESLYELLKDSVRMRLVSDVPLGAFLSGGIDSSSIVCMMSELMDRPVQTFSIGFDDPSYNELGYAGIVARHFGADHHEMVVKPDVVDLAESLVGYLDEPLADVSIFPTYLVSKLAREEVKVVLSGDGGDELFAGYDWYVADKIERQYRRLPSRLRTSIVPGLMGRIPPASQKKGVVNTLKRFVEGAAQPDSLRHYRWSTFMTEDRRSRLYGDGLRSLNGSRNTYSEFHAYLDAFDDSDPLWQEQYADIKTYLVDDILAKVDRMSMANSLEARTPFLDHRVVEFAAALPANLKLKGLKTKYLLKRTMEPRMPQEIRGRRKEGFSIPMKNWLTAELRPMMEDVLSPARMSQGGLFNSEYVEKMKREHVAGTANHAHQLWSLMVFEMWRDSYIHR